LRRITLAIDGSLESAQALEFVLTRLQPDRSTGKGKRVPIHVSVVHVIARRPLAPIDIGTTIPWTKYRGLKVTEVSQKLLEQSVQKLIQAGFTAKAVCVPGKPAEEIMKVAAKQHAELIVMGAQGLGAIARFLIGSVSTRVVQHSSCSVLVVR